ncbi:hypothetical protein [Chitinophaga sp. RAB17]|uniref:hypothetical protein n=1 Tax=Chitinophaga sp. RAB17 TaxID=3233049 RepID=UPI003F93C62F
MMTDALRAVVQQWLDEEISQNEFLALLPPGLQHDPNVLNALFQDILKQQLLTDVVYFLLILCKVEKENEHTSLLNQLMLEPWHCSYEDIVHMLQQRKDPESIPYIRTAMQQKYPCLEAYGTGTRQLINQCGWALYSIGTDEAITTIRELSASDDPVLRDEMCYRLSRVEGTRYERNYDLD